METLSFQTEITAVEQLPEVASQLLATFPNERFYAFFGPMGVGKTTLIKELCKQLGVSDVVCSPTFAIINEYHDACDNPVYHFDFYRIKTVGEAFDTGCVEYFNSGDYCFTEWTENIEQLLPDHYLRLVFSEKNEIRQLSVFVVNETL
ncbi:MAG: tRNA (adenosine(37)-N6)-threonylcarbamoyltransferase complex ATPase subunit type 1 TsaE [Bacteroidales bacterium]|nr:tRNA (adenosine(37)-N6)-threonylcarbamoyltransferase complex ATPase subunit type 1 TsaE [Bacteroidales bacterium]